MYNHKKSLSIVVAVFMLLQFSGLYTVPLYADDSVYGRIREVSSKRNDRLFNKIAIDLVNGKCRQVSIDRMVELLKQYEIVELDSKEIEPAQDIILREIAFRMLNEHYLPRVGDKIHVYRQQSEFSAGLGIAPPADRIKEVSIQLPLEAATVKDQNRLKAIYWTDMVMQVTSAIERLWVSRLNQQNMSIDAGNHDELLLEAAKVIKARYSQSQQGDYTSKDPSVARIADAAEGRLNSWVADGSIKKEDLPALANIIRQYVLLSGSLSVSRIVAELESFKNVGSLQEAIFWRISEATAVIKRSNPSDYAIFAMFQSLMNEVASQITRISRSGNNQSDTLKAQIKGPRHSG